MAACKEVSWEDVHSFSRVHDGPAVAGEAVLRGARGGLLVIQDNAASADECKVARADLDLIAKALNGQLA